jgi:hypothetical protein
MVRLCLTFPVLSFRKRDGMSFTTLHPCGGASGSGGMKRTKSLSTQTLKDLHSRINLSPPI